MKEKLEQLPPDSIVSFIKNDDGSFSPLALSSKQADFLNFMIGRLSEFDPLIRISEIKYINQH